MEVQPIKPRPWLVRLLLVPFAFRSHYKVIRRRRDDGAPRVSIRLAVPAAGKLALLLLRNFKR